MHACHDASERIKNNLDVPIDIEFKLRLGVKRKGWISLEGEVVVIQLRSKFFKIIITTSDPRVQREEVGMI